MQLTDRDASHTVVGNRHHEEERESHMKPDKILTTQGMQLLERYGVLTREAVLGESTRGGFAGVYGVLKMLEERGTVRRGYFVEGLGAAQFALPGAVDRLRADGPGGTGNGDSRAGHRVSVSAMRTAATSAAKGHDSQGCSTCIR